MNIDVDNIVRKMDVEKLIEENISSKVSEYIDVGDMVDDVLEDKKLKDFIQKRVTDIIDVYLSSDEGKECVIERFKDTIADPDTFLDDRVTDIIIEFLKRNLAQRY